MENTFYRITENFACVFVICSFQDQVQKNLRSMVQEEVGKALKEHSTTMTERISTYLRSTAGTPIPSSQTPDPSTVRALEAQIGHLVSQGRLNEAFQTVSGEVCCCPIKPTSILHLMFGWCCDAHYAVHVLSIYFL